jgi:hypothetical protein
MTFCGFASAAGRMRVTVPLIMRACVSHLSSYICEYLHYNFCRKIIINVRTRLDSSGRTMALGLTQSLTEMSTRNLGVKAASA